MSFLDDLAKSTQMFKQGATQFGTQQHINEATVTLEKMRTQHANAATGEIENEKELRKKQSELAKMLTANLTSIGSDANDIQMAFQAIAPKQFQTPDEMIMEGALTGSEFLQDTGKKVIQKTTGEKERIKNQSALDLWNQTTGRKFAIEQQQQMLGKNALAPSGYELINSSIATSMQEKNLGKFQEYDQTSAPLVDTLLELNELVERAGTTGFGSIEDRAQLNRLSIKAQLLSKDATYKLGVLNGADAEFLKGIMPTLGDVGAFTTFAQTAKTKYKSELDNVLTNRRRVLSNLNLRPSGRMLERRKGLAGSERVARTSGESIIAPRIPQEAMPGKKPASSSSPTMQVDAKKVGRMGAGGGAGDKFVGTIADMLRAQVKKTRETIKKRNEESRKLRERNRR